MGADYRMDAQQGKSCREAVYSNEYYDLIFDYISGYPRLESGCYQRVSEQYDIAYYARDQVPELNLQDYPYLTIPKCFGLSDLSALESSGILRLQNPEGLDLLGQGILVGFVDTGIDYTHPAFRNLDGSTRIAGIWDQTVEDGIPPEGFGYGQYFDEDSINRALQSEQPFGIVPSRDELGHGTFLAGVACGNADPAQDFSGAAPLASVAMVKCKQAKPYLREYYVIPESVPCYQENDLMLGMAWLMDLADQLGKPLILCVGMGSSMGNHAGEEPISMLADNYGRRRGRAIVIPAGNEAAARHHYSRTGLGEGMRERIEISVGENVPGFYLEFWAAVPEIYRLAVLSPGGERLEEGSGTEGRISHRFLFERTELTIDYTAAGARLGGQLIYLRFTDPYPGIWTVEVIPELVLEGTFHCWLPLTELMRGEVYFLRSSPDTTVLAPGFASVAVTAGAYQTVGGGISPESGRGYSILGDVKPDIAAPGVGVYGTEPGGGYGVRTGTSVAAAVTAGGCAQIFQWGIEENNFQYLNSRDLSQLLIRGAIRDTDRIYPNTSYGYGRLDVYRALDTLRRGI